MHDSRRSMCGSKDLRRCAIYTRTSTEEGLGRELNSLDVQREACTAFISSQQHEGWRPSRTRYDDGGYSGGTLQRPGLIRLLEDVSAGKINTVVVYKIDRLTRSLAGFAKIMDVLDATAASFVSVTQAFNTQTSMGRLTLNMLLSFAQFERELGSERVRDKIAAAKARGMWTGGMVPLGYNLVEHRLVVNPAEASTVRHVMETYLRLGTITETVATLEADGVRTKHQRLTRGRQRGGIPFRSGALRHLLGNETYLGRVRHKDRSYDGQHEAIVDRKLWEQVQATLAANARRRRCGTDARHPSLLAGMIWDRIGRRMSPSHTCKSRQRYRYYASNNATLPTSVADRDGAKLVWRIPAIELEAHVRSAVAEAVSGQARLDSSITAYGPHYGVSRHDRARDLAQQLREAKTCLARDLLLKLRLQVIVEDDHLRITFARWALGTLLNGDIPTAHADQAAEEVVVFRVPAAVSKRGRSIKLVLLPTGVRRLNPALMRLMAEAFSARRQLMDDVARQLEPRQLARLTREARLSYLAPDIVEAVLAGEQPPTFTATLLRRTSPIPLRWTEQRKLFGFHEPEGIRHELQPIFVQMIPGDKTS